MKNWQIWQLLRVILPQEIKYDDGSIYTVCGTVAFVYVNQISKEIVDEAGKMMRIQHEKLIGG